MNSKPFLKWAGGKGQLLNQFNRLFPEDLYKGNIENYVEPFVGGGAVFFYLSNLYDFKKVILNDLNRELILTYKVVQSHVEELINTLYLHEKEYSNKNKEERKLYYYSIRNEFNKQKINIIHSQFSNDWISFAANLIFLNRTCFNGLYRLNAKDSFNVPIGSYKNPLICDAENLRLVSKQLKRAILTSVDFENTITHGDLQPEKTLIYIDPPYRPLPNAKSFTSYSSIGFNENDQIRLANWFDVLAQKKYYVMLSNSDPSTIDSEDRFYDIHYGKWTVNTKLDNFFKVM